MKIKAKMKNFSKWKGLYQAERNIIRIFVGAIVLYLVAQIFVSLVVNFYGDQSFSVEALRSFLADLDVIWRWHIGGFFIFLDFAMFVAMFVFFKHGWKYRPQLVLYPPPSDLGQKVQIKPKIDPIILTHWKKIVERANTGTQENMKSAIIESDALLDQHLKNLGYEGEHLAERLGKLNYKAFKALDPVWKAHKLRNEIVHTPNSKVTPKQAQNTLLAYRNFFKETGAF